MSIILLRFATTRQYQVETNLNTRRFKLKLFRPTKYKLPRVRQKLTRLPDDLETPRPASKRKIKVELRKKFNPFKRVQIAEITNDEQKNDEQKNDEQKNDEDEPTT